MALGFDGDIDFDQYMIVAEGDDSLSVPIQHEGHFPVVIDSDLLPSLLKLGGEDYVSLGPVPDEVVIYPDITEVLDALQNNKIENYGKLVTFINFYFDLALATPLKPTRKMQRILYSTGDFTVYEDDIFALLRKKKISKRLAIDTVLTLYGTVQAHIRIYQKEHFEKLGLLDVS